MTEIKFNVIEKNCFFPRNEMYIARESLACVELQEYITAKVMNAQGDYVICYIRIADEQVVTLKPFEVQLTARARMALGGSQLQQITVIPLPFEKVIRRKAKVEELADRTVVASKQLIEKYGETVELINVENGYRKLFTLKETERYKDSYSIGFNRFDSLLMAARAENYEHSNIVIQSNEQKIDKRAYKKIYRQIVDWIQRKFIGYREIDLRVGYVYPFDENYDVARMHEESCKLLGIKEGDKILVSYNGAVKNLSVLYFNEEYANQITMVNDQFIDTHVTIGLNAVTKDALKIPNPGAIVLVKRNTKYIFQKHINLLLLPFIAIFFTIVQLTEFFTWPKEITISLLTVIVTPLIIFASLSEERAKVK